jgi:hypothetical protein
MVVHSMAQDASLVLVLCIGNCRRDVYRRLYRPSTYNELVEAVTAY